MTYPLSFVQERRVSSEQAADLLADAIRERKPYSFVRMNDGEAAIIGAGADVHEDEVGFFFKHWWNVQCVDLNYLDALKRGLLEAISQSNMLGFFDDMDKKPEKFSRCGRFIRKYANLDRVDVFVTAEAALDWHDRELMTKILEHADRITIITPFNLAAKVCRHFNKSTVSWIPIPGHAKYSAPGMSAYSHPFKRKDEILALLNQIGSGDVVLVGAGVLGKLYCNKVKERGGIAIDLGSVFDSWADNKRRLSTARHRRGF